jgi:molecular chaperone GrpE
MTMTSSTPRSSTTTSEGGSIVSDPQQAPGGVGAGSFQSEEHSAGAEGALDTDTTSARDSTASETALSVEALLDDLDRVTSERDSFLDDSRRIAAEFTNFRRQVEKRNAELLEHANSALVEKLLPTLDACDAALSHGAEDVGPVFATLLGTLEREGLARLDPKGEPFDPNLHEAVIHEEGDVEAPTVAEVLRIGYAWKGRVIRPAMVKVHG